MKKYLIYISIITLLFSGAYPEKQNSIPLNQFFKKLMEQALPPEDEIYYNFLISAEMLYGPQNFVNDIVKDIQQTYNYYYYKKSPDSLFFQHKSEVTSVLMNLIAIESGINLKINNLFDFKTKMESHFSSYNPDKNSFYEGLIPLYLSMLESKTNNKTKAWEYLNLYLTDDNYFKDDEIIDSVLPHFVLLLLLDGKNPVEVLQENNLFHLINERRIDSIFIVLDSYIGIYMNFYIEKFAKPVNNELFVDFIDYFIQNYDDIFDYNSYFSLFMFYNICFTETKNEINYNQIKKYLGDSFITSEDKNNFLNVFFSYLSFQINSENYENFQHSFKKFFDKIHEDDINILDNLQYKNYNDFLKIPDKFPVSNEYASIPIYLYKNNTFLSKNYHMGIVDDSLNIWFEKIGNFNILSALNETSAKTSFNSSRLYNNFNVKLFQFLMEEDFSQFICIEDFKEIIDFNKEKSNPSVLNEQIDIFDPYIILDYFRFYFRNEYYLNFTKTQPSLSPYFLSNLDKIKEAADSSISAEPEKINICTADFINYYIKYGKKQDSLLVLTELYSAVDKNFDKVNLTSKMYLINMISGENNIDNTIYKKYALTWLNKLIYEVRQSNLDSQTEIELYFLLLQMKFQYYFTTAQFFNDEVEFLLEEMIIYSDSLKDSEMKYTQMNNLAYFLIRKDKDKERSFRLINEAYKNLPNFSNMDTKGWWYFKYGEYGLAEGLFSILEKYSDHIQSSEVYYHLGRFNLYKKNNKKALKYLKRALNTHGENGVPLYPELKSEIEKWIKQIEEK